jgi:hypothetical protein
LLLILKKIKLSLKLPTNKMDTWPDDTLLDPQIIKEGVDDDSTTNPNTSISGITREPGQTGTSSLDEPLEARGSSSDPWDDDVVMTDGKFNKSVTPPSPNDLRLRNPTPEDFASRPPTKFERVKEAVERIIPYLVFASRMIDMHPIINGSLAEAQRREFEARKPAITVDYVDGANLLEVYEGYNLVEEMKKPTARTFLNRLVFPLSSIVSGSFRSEFSGEPFNTSHIKYISPLGTEIVFDALMGEKTDLQGNPFYHMKIAGNDTALYFDEATGEVDMYPLDDIYNAVSAERVPLEEGWDAPVTTLNAQVGKLGLLDKPNPELHILMTDQNGIPVENIVIDDIGQIKEMTQKGVVSLFVTANAESAANLRRLKLPFVYSDKINKDTSITLAGSSIQGSVLRLNESGELVETYGVDPQLDAIVFTGVGTSIHRTDDQFPKG